MVKLKQLEGIAPEEADLLEATGWLDARSLAKAKVELLFDELQVANDALKILPTAPERSQVEAWVALAQGAVDSMVSESPEQRAVSEVPEKRVVPVKKAARKSAKPAKKAAKKAARKLAKKVDDPIPSSVPKEDAELAAAVEEDSGEAQLRALAGPVNFEADPNVAEMLAAAPFALPIAARELAEKKIPPSEIPVSPLLNRALGDLEVKISVERPQRQDLPPAIIDSRRGATPAAVQSADLGFSSSRRGFDSSRMRTVEDVQGEARPIRPQVTTPKSPDEDRIALLRAPRPETNAGRNPASRFYIRGVLHDRPLLVWFGGLIVLLLQICLPLAVVAAPLLILSDQANGDFAWVSGWVIAFPMALPLLAMLYLMISRSAKCRVCAQRMYASKNCLKNRKAHHVPLLGHIGAVALHVMTFKWFNCTFCGTSIRIKK